MKDKTHYSQREYDFAIFSKRQFFKTNCRENNFFFVNQLFNHFRRHLEITEAKRMSDVIIAIRWLTTYISIESSTIPSFFFLCLDKILIFHQSCPTDLNAQNFSLVQVFPFPYYKVNTRFFLKWRTSNVCKAVEIWPPLRRKFI